MAFYRGQRAVCVVEREAFYGGLTADQRDKRWGPDPVKGTVYTIANIFDIEGMPLFELVGLPPEFVYPALAFRPAVDGEIERLRAIAKAPSLFEAV